MTLVDDVCRYQRLGVIENRVASIVSQERVNRNPLTVQEKPIAEVAAFLFVLRVPEFPTVPVS